MSYIRNPNNGFIFVIRTCCQTKTIWTECVLCLGRISRCRCRLSLFQMVMPWTLTYIFNNASEYVMFWKATTPWTVTISLHILPMWPNANLRKLRHWKHCLILPSDQIRTIKLTHFRMIPGSFLVWKGIENGYRQPTGILFQVFPFGRFEHDSWWKSYLM